MTTVEVSRERVLAYRAQVHGLEAPGDAVLGAGVRDSPPGRTAHLALRPRAPGVAVRDGVAGGDLPLVYGVRGATHVHRAADLPLLAAALRPEDNAAPAPASFGRFGTELATQGVDLPAVLDQVVEAMRRVAADGTARTKGELSGAVTPLVDPRVAPWCDGCGVSHVHDGVWRYATLQAGLRLVHDPSAGGSTLIRWAAPGGADRAHRTADRDESRRALTGRFLHLFGLLLPPYDPVLELADRELLLPDKQARGRSGARSPTSE